MSATVESVESILPARVKPRWKSAGAVTSAVLLSILFLASGVWKISDLDATSQRMVQSLIPVAWSMPASIAVAICETFAGILLLIPRHRRWGAWIAGAMLLAFMVYIGVLYDRLLGEDCNCFPWIQRVVGPVFFIGDALMLLLAALAGAWSMKPAGWRRAAVVLLGVVVVTAGAFAASVIRRSQADAPETTVVGGKALNLRSGRVLLYFFDPECSHCYLVAREMGKRNWGSTRVVVLATQGHRFTASFLESTGLPAGASPDGAPLRKIFPFTDPPYAVALDKGKAVATFNSGQMELETYYETLARLGHLQSGKEGKSD